MSSPPPHKRQKSNSSNTSANVTVPEGRPEASNMTPPQSNISLAPPPPTSPTNPRKRRASHSPKFNTLPPGTTLPPPPSQPSVHTESSTNLAIPALLTEDSGKKRGRTNTPWSAAEEQRLKQMRDAGNSWSEIAKAFPTRTEGSVKKHWYKDMHYAEFAEDEVRTQSSQVEMAINPVQSAALRDAIKEYEANKWKAIGQKLGKPAKACEQYAKEHFKNL